MLFKPRCGFSLPSDAVFVLRKYCLASVANHTEIHLVFKNQLTILGRKWGIGSSRIAPRYVAHDIAYCTEGLLLDFPEEAVGIRSYSPYNHRVNEQEWPIEKCFNFSASANSRSAFQYPIHAFDAWLTSKLSEGMRERT